MIALIIFFCFILLPIFIGVLDVGFSSVGFFIGEFHERHIGWKEGVKFIEWLDTFMKSGESANY